MKKGETNVKYLIFFLVLFSPWTGGQDKPTDAKTVLKELFWGQLYVDGGITFFCEEVFDRKSVLITEGYIFATSWMRDHLECGTPWQCRESSPDYQKMTADMHNIFPENARFDLDRRAARFEDLPDETSVESCGFKRSFGIIEPPDRIKGDIARALLYMNRAYNLPLHGDLNQLKHWNRIDPPSDEEKARNLKIADLQGNGNQFILYPELAEIVTLP